MPFHIDQTGNQVFLKDCPKRIISLVPSQTELLYYLGLRDEIIAITKFCIHPFEWHHEKQKVGGTKQLKPDLIRKLLPDLVIGNKEENVKEEVEALQKDFPVWISDVKTLADATRMIELIGELTCTTLKAKQLIVQINTGFSELIRTPCFNAKPIPAAYLIWKDPYMAAGGDNFINDMMKYCNLENVFQQLPRYPVIDIKKLEDSGCRLLLLSSEPFPFGEQHIKELEVMIPGIIILLVDGEMFSWYGNRLLIAVEYFRKFTMDLSMKGI